MISPSLFRTQGSTVGDGEDQEDFPIELSVYPDPLTPEGLQCTQANVLMVHRDTQPGKYTVLLSMQKTCDVEILK